MRPSSRFGSSQPIVSGPCDLVSGACASCNKGTFGKFCENSCQNCANGCDESGCIGGLCRGDFLLYPNVGPFCNISCSRCSDFDKPVRRKFCGFESFLTKHLQATSGKMICDLNVGCVKNNATLPNCVEPEWIGSSSLLYCKDGGCRNGKIGSKCEDDCSPYCALDQNGACTDRANEYDFSFCKLGCSALAVPEESSISNSILCRSIDSDSGRTIAIVIGVIVGGMFLCFIVAAIALSLHRQQELARFSRAQQQTHVITSLQQPNQQAYMQPHLPPKQGGFPEPTAFSQPAQPAQVYQPQAPFVSQSQAQRDHQPSAPTDLSSAI
jgi:hypothetical protein